MGLGDRIKQARGDLTQREFAEKIGAGLSTVQAWEAKDKFPGGESLCRMRAEFGIDINWLLTGEGVPQIKTAAELIDDFAYPFAKFVLSENNIALDECNVIDEHKRIAITEFIKHSLIKNIIIKIVGYAKICSAIYDSTGALNVTTKNEGKCNDEKIKEFSHYLVDLVMSLLNVSVDELAKEKIAKHVYNMIDTDLKNEIIGFFEVAKLEHI